MDFDDSFEDALKALVKSESLVTVELTGKDTGIEGKIAHVGDDYIKIKPERTATGRVYFVQLSAISYIDTAQPTESDLDTDFPNEQKAALPSERRDDRFRRRLDL